MPSPRRAWVFWWLRTLSALHRGFFSVCRTSACLCFLIPMNIANCWVCLLLFAVFAISPLLPKALRIFLSFNSLAGGNKQTQSKLLRHGPALQWNLRYLTGAERSRVHGARPNPMLLWFSGVKTYRELLLISGLFYFNIPNFFLKSSKKSMEVIGQHSFYTRCQ